MDVDRLLASLYVGACPASAGEIDWLRSQHGVTAVLSVQTDEDLDYCGIDWPQLAAYYQTVGIEVRREPVPDFDAVALCRRLPQCVATLQALLAAGHTVFLHCTAGVNRSPTVAIAYLYWVEGWTFEAAARHVMTFHACQPYLNVIRLATEGWQEQRGAGGGMQE